MVTRTSAMLLLRPVVTRGGITIGATVMPRSTTTTTTTKVTAGTGTTRLTTTGTIRLTTASNNVNNWNRSAANSSSRLPTQGQGAWQHNPTHRGNAPYGNRDLANRFGQDNNRLSGGAGNRASQPATARATNQLAQGNRFSQPTSANAGNQLARNNLSRPTGGARPSTRPSNVGAPNRVGNRVPSNWPSTARGGAFGPSNGDLARAFSGRGAQSMAPSRMGPPQGLRAGGPPMGGGFRGGPPMAVVSAEVRRWVAASVAVRRSVVACR